MRLREKPLSRTTAFVGVENFNSVVELLKHMDGGLGGSLSAFEVMWRDFYELVAKGSKRGGGPIGTHHQFYALVENQGANPKLDTENFQALLESALEMGLIEDAAIARSERESLEFWSLRDDVERTFQWGEPIIFDVSLPVDKMESYTTALQENLETLMRGTKVWIFGHLGDGNLHLCIQTPDGEAVTHRKIIERCVYEPLQPIGGSVSAEHGIGLEKKPYLHLCRSEAEIRLMRTLKAALDPKGLLNPGKIFNHL